MSRKSLEDRISSEPNKQKVELSPQDKLSQKKKHQLRSILEHSDPEQFTK